MRKSRAVLQSRIHMPHNKSSSRQSPARMMPSNPRRQPCESNRAPRTQIKREHQITKPPEKRSRISPRAHPPQRRKKLFPTEPSLAPKNSRITSQISAFKSRPEIACCPQSSSTAYPTRSAINPPFTRHSPSFIHVRPACRRHLYATL